MIFGMHGSLRSKAKRLSKTLKIMDNWRLTFLWEEKVDIFGNSIKGLCYKRDTIQIWEEADQIGWINFHVEQYVKNKKDIFKAKLMGNIDSTWSI